MQATTLFKNTYMKLLISKLFIVFIGLLAVVSCNNSKNKFNQIGLDYQPFAKDTVATNWNQLNLEQKAYPSDSLYVPYSYQFKSIYTKGNNIFCFDLNLFFASNTADSMVGIYSLYIHHDTKFYKKHPAHKDKLVREKSPEYSDGYPYDTIIRSHAIGVFRIEKDHIFLEHSLPFHYQDSLCTKLLALNICICNANNTYNDEDYEDYLKYGPMLTNKRIFGDPQRKNVEVPFGLEIEPTSFFIKTVVDNEKVKAIFSLEDPYYPSYFNPIVILSSEENLKIRHWVSQRKIRKKYPEESPRKELYYPLFQKKEIDISNTLTFLVQSNEFSFEKNKAKYLSLLLSLTNKPYGRFGPCKAVDILDIYELLLRYTTEERLKRENK